VKIDWSFALEMEGVLGKVDHNDVPEKNKFGVLVEDEEIFADNEVNYRTDYFLKDSEHNTNTARLICAFHMC
jgi:xanthine dehydrogenase molybdopterin-binding subunit B